MLWKQQHQSYLHYVLIPSEPEPFCLDKLIPEELPLLEAPPVVRLVHLYNLLCGVTFDRSPTSNVLPLRVCLRQETGTIGIEQSERTFVADAPAEFGVRPTSAAQVRPSAGMCCDLPCNRTPFLCYYGELHHSHDSLLINKIVGCAEFVKLV